MNARGINCLLIAFALALSGCGKLGAVLAPQGKPKSGDYTLKAKVRDFREGSATTKDGTHPHFNQNTWACDPVALAANTVEENLDVGQAKDAGFPGDNRGPVLLPNLPVGISRCFDPPDRFSDWYQDRDSDINRPFLIDLTFTKNDDGTYGYHNLRFFPIDNGGDFRKESSGGPDPFGHLQTGTKDEVDLTLHNYGFTMEMHPHFTYVAGSGQYFNVDADDDFWAFVNGKRAIDLGGSHPSLHGAINLDEAKDYLGLVDQQKYPLDFFFAERVVASSRLVITTNVRMTE
jgi:fibro-slime domain-containing protein